MATLVIHSEEEIVDLCQWSIDHSDIDTREFLEWQTSAKEYPAEFDIPDYLVDSIKRLINDWGDYLAAQDEPLYTYVRG